MAQVQVRVNEWLTDGFNLYKANFGLFVLASLVALVLSAVTFGILAGPMMSGLIYIALKLREGKFPKPGVGDIFKGFRWFVQSFLLFLVWGVGSTIVVLILSPIPVIGMLATIVIGLGVPSILIFAPYLIVEKNRPFWPASLASINMIKRNLWPFIGFGVLATILGSIGGVVCGIGAIFTIPIQVCMVSAAYSEIFMDGQYVETPPSLKSSGAEKFSVFDHDADDRFDDDTDSGLDDASGGDSDAGSDSGSDSSGDD